MDQLNQAPESMAQPQNSRILLIAAAIVTVGLWQLPFGNYILYPFTILATWFHEMGHGLMAMLVGGSFEKLMIFSDGSGVAFHRGGGWLGGVGQALVAAAGPMGPPIAGSGLLLASRFERTTRYGLIGLGGLLILSTLIWIRSLFGWMAIPVIGLGILAVGLWSPHWVQGLMIQFLGVQACISTYHQIDYLFMENAVVGGRLMLSDSSQIAQHLLFPYWVWGGLMMIGSILLLVQSLRIATADPG